MINKHVWLKSFTDCPDYSILSQQLDRVCEKFIGNNFPWMANFTGRGQECGIWNAKGGQNAEVGPAVVPSERDYGAARDAGVGKAGRIWKWEDGR